MCVQVCRIIKLNTDSYSQGLVLKYQDSERKWKHLRQKRSFSDFKHDLKEGQL